MLSHSFQLKAQSGSHGAGTSTGLPRWPVRSLLTLAAVAAVMAPAVAAPPPYSGNLPSADLQFLSEMTRDVVEASRVPAGSNGGGRWPITNSCGFTLITPGRDTYTAFWIRDFSMAADSGFITAEELRQHLRLVCQVQNGPTERRLAHGLHVPPWAIPDHINYDGRASFYPGTYDSGPDQGAGAFGRLPPVDDHYEVIHIAHVYWLAGHNAGVFREAIGGVSVFDHLCCAFSSPSADPATGMVQTTEENRAVGFGFCDAEAHTGKLLMASLLRYRAAGELAELARSLGHDERAAPYQHIRRQIQANASKAFADRRAIGGWLRAATELSRQPDVWGTLFALHLGVLRGADARAARREVADAVRRGTITFQGGVRQVPADRDFSTQSAWERSLSPINTYQNGGYWHTATGWLIEALWDEDRGLALGVFEEMTQQLRQQDYRLGRGHGAPWEVFGRGGTARQNPLYLASVALPYSILKGLPRR